MITIDASGADGMDFEAYIRGGFLTGLPGTQPSFDNSTAFTGEELFLGYGTAADSKYVLAHGAITYSFIPAHTVYGTINTIEFGTQGTGSFDANGYFLGGTVELSITGLDLTNAATPEAEVEANGPVHNFASAYMAGAGASATQLGVFADALDAEAQHFIGSSGDDTYTGTNFDDIIEGNGGADELSGGGGNDELTGGAGNDALDGGDGDDTVTYSGNKANYTVKVSADGATITVVDKRSGAPDGTDTLDNVEHIKFADQTIDAPVNKAPTLSLTGDSVAENAAVGAVVGTLSASDPEGGTIIYSLTNDAGGLFELVDKQIRLKAGLDYETASSHEIEVVATDQAGNETTKAFTIDVTDVSEVAPKGTITIDASGSDGMDFEAFILGGFLADATGGGFPVFDNDLMTFSGEEMMMNYADPAEVTADTKYVLAHGTLEYAFSSHTVAGTINTIEYGVRGSGAYDANGYFVGGDVALRITGLDFFNLAGNEYEETGATHNFSVAHMYGANADPARLARYAEQLDEYAQHFIGSGGNDTYAGTQFDDTIEGGNGEDTLAGGGGNDTVDGGDGADRLVLRGNLADYEIVKNPDGTTTVTDRRANGNDGRSVLRNIEFLQFADQTVQLVDNLPPTAILLSDNEVAEGTAVGSVVGVIAATDPEGGALTYALTDDALGKFELVGTELRVKSELDYEAGDSFDVTVEVIDQAGNVASKTFKIEITDVVEGTEGKDKLTGTDGDDHIAGFAGKDKLKGGDGADTLDGGSGKDKLEGNSGDDILVGGAGDDTLKGGGGKDKLTGGLGADKLHGGSGADSFIFLSVGDSTNGGSGRDVIYDFKRSEGDLIDLSAIDPATDDLAFDFIGKGGFDGVAGELRFSKKDGETFVRGDLDGDGHADFTIVLADGISLKAGDFVL